MKYFRSILALILFISFQSGYSQLILPQFNSATKLDVFNSDGEESSPVFFNEGNGIYFSRTYFQGKGEKQQAIGQDIFISTKVEGKWKKPIRLFRGEVVPGENEIVGTSLDGKRIYLLNTIIEKDTSYRRLIYINEIEEEEWSEPVEVIIPGLVLGQKYANFYITHDEKVLLISISRSEKILNEDLFVSLKDKNGKWGTPINLGNKINTSQFEVYPFISDNGKNLYFSSNGHRGYGASDIFVSHRLDDSWTKWTTPLNLGEPINSEDYDASFYMANNSDVYFTSNRNSNHNNIYLTTTTGKFKYANSIQGILAFQGKKLGNKKLNVFDDKGNLVEEITTSDKGVFKFIKLNTDDNFVVKLANEDAEMYEGSKIYFEDANGVKTKRYILTKDGMFVNSKDLDGETEIVGVFNYNSLPSMKSGLVVFDENGFPLDTIYTDEEGKFIYSFLKFDDQYSISPLNMTNDDFNNVDMYLVDELGNKLKPIQPGKLHILTKKKEEVAMKTIENKDPAGKDLEFIEGADTEIAAYKASKNNNNLIFFKLNSYTLSEKEKTKLTMPLSILNLDKTRNIELVGHTDNSGSDATNKSISKLRAEAVSAYFISKGIQSNRITITAKGEANPIFDNTLRANRVKNRNVEIIIE